MNLWHRVHGAIEKYGLIIIDEAGLVRRHFVGGTFEDVPKSWSGRNVLHGRSDHLLVSQCIALLQGALSKSDVAFCSAL